MFLRMENWPGKKLIGQRVNMSFANDKTPLLWRGFMPRRKEILNAIGTDLYCVQQYDNLNIVTPDPNSLFDKWATVEVSSFDTIPTGMESLIIPPGSYAVFLHKGSAATGHISFQYIFGEWIPSSVYTIDDRPHFEVLGERYKNNDPDSEEEIWIPVKNK